MKQVFADRIVNIDDNLYDGKFLLYAAIECAYESLVDLSVLLAPHRNISIEYRKDFKLWGEVYSPKVELEIFKEVFADAKKKHKKIHISNISLKEEIEMVKELYDDLGYFDPDLNMFVPDFENAPVTLGVNMRNVILSSKDYKSKRESICHIPPPREPMHQKAIKNALNSGVISMIHMNAWNEEVPYIKLLLQEERTNLIKLSNQLYYNFQKRGFDVTFKEVMMIEGI